MLEEVAQELQRDVLEGERRPVGQAQQVQTGLQRHERSDVFAAEGGRRVGASDDRFEIGRRDVIDVTLQDREGEIAIA